MKKEIEFDRISSDINGNPRYVCHFLSLINEQDREHVKQKRYDKFGLEIKDTRFDISKLYDIALIRARKIGGRKFHNKQYGGGIVFQSYNIGDTEKAINELVNNIMYVKFLIEKDSKDEVFAFFPYTHARHERHPNYNMVFECYSHVGQHSACDVGYASECKPAGPRKYADLKKELESIGYNLEIIK
jgi:hypothetical protein